MAQSYAVYTRTVSGKELNSFSATIQLIPPTFKTRNVSSTFYIVRNLGGGASQPKEIYFQTYVFDREKRYSSPFATPGNYTTGAWRDIAVPEIIELTTGAAATPTPPRQRVLLERSTEGSPVNYSVNLLTAQSNDRFKRRVVRNYIDLSSTPANPGSITLSSARTNHLQGLQTMVRLPKSSIDISVVPTFTGEGNSWELFNGVDTAPPNNSDFEGTDLYLLSFKETWKLNVALSDRCTTGPPAVLAATTLNSGTDAYAAYQLASFLEKLGYEPES
jgi:hypothetical protein